MKAVVAAIGSRGDVVPFSNLAARLAARGHDVTLVTHSSLSHLVPGGLPVLGVPSDPGALLSSPAAKALRSGSVRALNRTRNIFADFLHSAGPPAGEALAGADVLVASTFAIAPVDEALKAGVPVVRTHLWPEFEALDGPMPLLPYGWRIPSPVRKLARKSLRWAEPYLGGVEGGWRRGRLHLTARHPVGLTTSTLGSLYAYSPALGATPPTGGVATGWWTAGPDPEPLSPETDDALDDGADWIYAGFGSMTQSHPEKLIATLGAACDRIGMNAVVQLDRLRGRPHPRVLCVGPEPHGELFRRVKVVVHHGGAGTTSSAVRAGTPSVVLPHFADQFYWGKRLHDLGVAASPIPRPVVRPGKLARRLRQAAAPAMQQRAAELGRAVAGEDGCGRAIDQVERWLAERR